MNTPLRWKKSSYTGANGDCVEAATEPHAVFVRDSKAPETGVLVVPPTSWAKFLGDLK